MRTALRTIVLAIRAWLPSELFRQSEVGVWYDPSDLTSMFQDSAGTTAAAIEQPVGLLLDKSKGLVLGAELGSANWTLGANWTLVNGVFTCNGVSTATASNTVPLVAGKTYLYAINVLSGSGSLALYLGSTVSKLITVSSGNQYQFIAAASGDLTIYLQGGAVFTGSLTLSVRELPGNHASQATSASRPTLSARVNLLTKTEQFDDVAWTKSGATVTANAIAAPDGTLTADALIASAATATHFIYSEAFAINAASPASIYVKAKEYSKVAILEGQNANEVGAFDLSTGTKLYESSANVSSITPVGDGWYRISVNAARLAGSRLAVYILSPSYTTGTVLTSWLGDGTSGIYIWGASLVPANQASLPYQRVDTASVYDTVGFKTYLKFDGVDDSLATGSIDFTATDKMTVVAGVRKLSDAAEGYLVALSGSMANLGCFAIRAPRTAAGGQYSFTLNASVAAGYDATTFAAPVTNVLSVGFNASGATQADKILPRINGAIPTLTLVGANSGTGNFRNDPLYIGALGGTSAYFNGHLYSMIIRGAQTTDAQIVAAETYVNGKTGAY